MWLYFGFVLCVWGAYAVLVRKAIRQRNGRVLCLILASVLPAAYLLGMQSSGQIVYGGLLGDNSFQIALLNNVIHGNYFGDYYQKALPLDYPPLFFWVLGTLSRWLHLDAITAWRLFPVALLALWPFVFFQTGKKLGDEETAIWVCIGALGIGALNTRFFGFTLPQRDWGTFSLALNKPYEMLSAFFLLDSIIECGIRQFALNKRNLFKTFVTGGIVALLYYPFLMPGVLTLNFRILARKIPDCSKKYSSDRSCVVVRRSSSRFPFLGDDRLCFLEFSPRGELSYRLHCLMAFRPHWLYRRFGLWGWIVSIRSADRVATLETRC